MRRLRGMAMLFVLATSMQAFACDVCGCAIGGTNFGILPQFYKNYVGVHYSQKYFSTKHTNSSSNEGLHSKESFYSAELKVRLNILKKVQVFAFLPFNNNQQNENGLQTSFYGLGDASFLANYTLVNTNNAECTSPWNHNLQVGLGLKLPTGSYKKLSKDLSYNPYLQLGSGSVDFLADAIYVLRYKQVGLNTSLVYRLNTRNSYGYLFGNRLTTNMNFFYWGKVKEISLLPNIGAVVENAALDQHHQTRLSMSGGTTLLASLGLDIYFKKFTIGGNWQAPCYQQNKIVNPASRFNINFLYNF